MRLTVLETSPNAPNSIKNHLYHRVGSGEAAANYEICIFFDIRILISCINQYKGITTRYEDKVLAHGIKTGYEDKVLR